jgi:hypothetical protein
MDRPRLLLVPEFTELTWTIRPQLEEWAEVASYDPPGIGDEPPLDPDPANFSRDWIVRRGLEELDRRGWERFFVLADGWAIPAATGIAEARRDSILGMALGHATVSLSREGDRPANSAAVYDALTQLLDQDHDAFVRHGIAQATGGSIDEKLADRMVERFPKDLMLAGWKTITADDERFGDVLRDLEVPMLLAKHQGCLMSTEEGFEDAVKALPDALTIAVPDAPSTSDEFAAAVKEFCEEVSRRPVREPAGRSARAPRPTRR